jgi:acetoin utilization deacetylase AcuC-like enzyme
MKTGLASDPRFRDHAPPGSQPERPERLAAIEARLAVDGLRDRAVAIAARAATRAELERVHAPAYLDAAERTIRERGTGWLDPDTYFCPASWDTAVLAAGTAVAVAEAVADGALDNGIALLRPPGHHATADRAMGFCLVNNVAVAAAALAARGARVAVCDFDVHHGNGTQDIFYEDGRVLFTSTHQHPFYPGTGRVDERGAGAGRGATLNVPLPSGAGDDALVAAWEDVILPAVSRFAPDVVLGSAGFDAHEADPLAGLRATESGFARIVHGLLRAAPAGRLALVLEGGYDLAALAASVAATMRVLLGEPPPPLSRHPLADPERRAIEQAARSLSELPVPSP